MCRQCEKQCQQTWPPIISYIIFNKTIAITALTLITLYEVWLSSCPSLVLKPPTAHGNGELECIMPVSQSSL